MKKYFYLLILITPLFVSCKYGLQQFLYRSNSIEKRIEPLQKIEFADESLKNTITNDDYSFIVISDTHFGSKVQKNTQDFFNKINDLPEKPLFCFSLGDMTETGSEEYYKDYLDKIENPLNNMNIKVFNIVGNHDLYNDGYECFKKYSYPFNSFYYFETGAFDFYFIDTGSGTLGNNQFNQLEQSLKSKNKYKIIFSHYAIYADDDFYFILQDTDERNRLINLCATTNVKYFVDGHVHTSNYSDYGKFEEQNIPACFEFRQFAYCNVIQTAGDPKITFEIIDF